MDKEVIKDLLLKYQKRKSKKIKSQIVEEAKPLVYVVAKKFIYQGENFKDLTQVGLIGLLKAIDDYQDQGNNEHMAYMVKKIVGEIKHCFRDKYKLIKVPRRYYKVYQDMNKYIQKYVQKNKGKAPLVKDIAKAIGAAEEDVLETMEIMHSCSMLNSDKKKVFNSFFGDNNFSGEGNRSGLTISVDFEDKIDDSLMLDKILQTLSFRERKILQLYFTNDLTQEEISKRFKLSQVGVFRIIKKALRRCRVALVREKKFEKLFAGYDDEG